MNQAPQAAPIDVLLVEDSRDDAELTLHALQVAKSYRLHANAYVTKPIEPAAFLRAVSAIGRFWLEIVRRP